MSNSPLVTHAHLSPNCTKPRNHIIDTISIHCVGANGSIEALGSLFANPKKQASSNYGIGSDGRIAMYVEEHNRSWCTSSPSNDHRAITIEVANNGGAPDWPVSDKAFSSLIDLITDICERNGIKRLLWRGDKDLVGQVDKQNMTVHRWFANKTCPGDYLYNKHYYIAEEVNRRLKEVKPVDKLDNTPDGYAKTTIDWAIKNKILFGDDKGNLKLHEPATRQDVLVFIKRVYDVMK